MLHNYGLAWQQVRVPRRLPPLPLLPPHLYDDDRWPDEVMRALTPCAVLVLGVGVLLYGAGGPEAPLGLALAVALPVTRVLVVLAQLVDRRPWGRLDPSC